MGIDSRVQASGQKKSILVCLTWKEPWMKSPVASVVPWPQPSHHRVWTSVSSAKGEDWTKWTQVGLSGSKRHCPSGQKNPWCHFSSPAVPWRGSRGSGRLLSQSHYQSGLQASWRVGTHLHAQARSSSASALPLFFTCPVPGAHPTALSDAHGPQSLPPSHRHTQNRRRRWFKRIGLLACGMDLLVSPCTDATLI